MMNKNTSNSNSEPKDVTVPTLPEQLQLRGLDGVVCVFQLTIQ